MTVTELSRVFRFKPGKGDNIDLPDPNPNFNLDQVMEHYSSQYPELGNAVVSRSKDSKGDKVVYELKSVFETKG